MEKRNGRGGRRRWRQWTEERARRNALQRDRASSSAALQRAVRGAMTPYDALFPGDWDLLVHDRGRSYWAVDQHCVNPACSCDEVCVVLHELHTGHAEHVGDMRVDFSSRPPTRIPTSARVRRLFEIVWAKHAAELSRRYAEVRSVVRALAAGSQVTGLAIGSRPPPSRNAFCPCGSGAKYKRCCANRDSPRAP